MKKSILFLILVSNLFANDILTKKVIEAEENIEKAIKKDRLYDFFATLGITSLKRNIDSSNIEYNINTLYEVEVGIRLLPDSYKITLSYKTSINNDSNKDSFNSDTSNARSILFNTTLLENRKYGYLNFDYVDILLHGNMKNIGQTDINLYEREQIINILGQDIKTFQTLSPSEELKTTEKTKIATLIYRFPKWPFLGVLTSYAKRELPVVLESNNITSLTEHTKAEGLFYGVGFFNNFKKAPKYKIVLESLVYSIGSLDATSTIATGIGDIDNKLKVKSFIGSLGYKFNKFNMYIRSRYSKAKNEDISVDGIKGIDQEEYDFKVLVKYFF